MKRTNCSRTGAPAGHTIAAAGMILMAGMGFGALVGSTLGGCASSGDRFVSDKPLADLGNPKADKRLRVNAVDAARAQAADDPVAVKATVAAYRDILWRPSEPVEVRERVWQVMVNDTDPTVVEAARAEGRNLLPLEPSRRMVVNMARTAAERGWTDYTAPLIRSWARAVGQALEEDDRAERTALTTLHPGVAPERVVLDTFVSPPTAPEGSSADWLRRFRRDAWDLLGRLDADGSMRMDLVTSAYAVDSSDAALVAIRRCAAELNAIPITGDELSWVTSLLDESKPENAAWWREAAAAVARVKGKGPFQVRHAEPLRWAAANRPQWLDASREDLLRELEGRLASRTRYSRKSDEGGQTILDTPGDFGERFRWADVLTVLVIDDALATPGLIDTLATQAALDTSDTTTEYGGIIGFGDQLRARGGGGGGGARQAAATGRPVAVLYPPRPRERAGDNRFVASADMIAASDRALAHYHFHVQNARNSDYAGPSGGDLTYAARSGRNCIVITSVGVGVYNIDYYQPDGKVIDLGTLEAGTQVGSRGN
jgi:hypothetical protein